MAVQALYLHIPFCHARCAYCDFETCARFGAALERESARYVDQLEARIDAWGEAGLLSSVETVYIGGGTPTVVGERLPELVRRVLRWCAPVEVSTEANPESFSDSLAEKLAQAGVTRVSLGVQSLVDAELSAIGRIHSASEALAAIERARRFGFSVSCDLMCGLPGQTSESWRYTVGTALAAHIDHLSVYPLTIEEGTPLARRVERDPSLAPDEDFQAACMEVARAASEQAGLFPYEVASYARPGCACRHNIAYWSGVSYVGMGRAAASMLTRSEWEAASAFFPGVSVAHDAERVRLVQRDDAAQTFDAECLTEREAIAEDLMLGMRMTAGISKSLADRARAVFGDSFDAAVSAARDEGLLRFNEVDGSFAPTDRGWLMGNELYGLMWGLAD